MKAEIAAHGKGLLNQEFRSESLNELGGIKLIETMEDEATFLIKNVGFILLLKDR